VQRITIYEPDEIVGPDLLPRIPISVVKCGAVASQEIPYRFLGNQRLELSHRRGPYVSGHHKLKRFICEVAPLISNQRRTTSFWKSKRCSSGDQRCRRRIARE